ncbi:MAG: Flp pilus assembly protein CpaB [Hyphomicrobiaceae bacterium]
MKRGQLIALALAAISGLGAILLVNSMMKRPPPKPVVVEKPVATQVLVARSDIGLGQVANESSFRWQEWPKEATVRGFITRQSKPQAIVDLSGTIARMPILAGEPINEAKLVRAESGGVLAAILKKGMRALSIRIKEETVAGRLILPNDHVDVLKVSRVRDKKGGEGTVSETLLRNIRVLAIGQNIDSKDGKRTLEGATVTLELSPSDAEGLAKASSAGEITLALRSIADTAQDVAEEVKRKTKSADNTTIIRYGVVTAKPVH